MLFDNRLTTPLIITFIVLAVLTTFVARAEQSAENDLHTIRTRLVEELLRSETDNDQINRLVKTIRDDGRWPDINYDDFSHTGFEHSRHLGNIFNLCRAFKQPGSQFYHSRDILHIISSALDLWIEHDFIASNWHTNEISGPENWANILLIMDTGLTDRQITAILSMAKRANMNAWGARPGGDLVKIAGIMAKVAVYENNENMLKRAIDEISAEIRITSGKGIKPDLSFHHRVDRVTSVLSYGTGYAGVYADWAIKLMGTKFAFPDKSMELVIDYFLDGICQTMVFATYPDPGAMNRGISRPGALRRRSSDLPEKLLMASAYRSDELKSIIDIRKETKEPNLSGSRFYWHSEYYSHQRPHFFTSVRMHSDRNRNMEYPHNQESIRHHHYADGSNFISRTGMEYFDIYPVFDWMKIPGTTVLQKPGIPGPGSIVKRGLTDFAGGASDGEYGVAAFDFSSPHDPVKAKKAWFMFDNEIVCLGNSIESSSDYAVATAINQCLLNDKVTYQTNKTISDLNKGEHSLKDVGWVYHDKIAYYFPEPSNISISNVAATGSWYDINRQSRSPRERITKETFKLWFDHGSTPRMGTYEYIVIPGIEREQIESYINDSAIEIIINNHEIQAVKNKILNLSQIVFYQPGSIEISNNLTIGSQKPGLVMVKTNGNNIEKIIVADPTRKLNEMHLRVNIRIEGAGGNWNAIWNKNEKYSEVFIGLPAGYQAGKSVSIFPGLEYHHEKPYIPVSMAKKETDETGMIKKGEKYYIGKEYGGGIIYYLDETGNHGLISAFTDQSDGVRWKNGISTISHSLGSHRDRVTNANGNGIGSGFMNTSIIISQLTADNPFNSFAARECADYQSEGFGDWYLPSKHELDVLYHQREIVGNFKGDLYWSSTEYNVGFSWGQSFHSYGGEYAYNKGTASNVRCIRKF